MQLSWSTLALMCLAAAGAWFWQDSLAARERANAAAIEACQRLGLQFLDGTAAFARLSFTRVMGRLTLQRTYVFDYTANSIERRQGFIVLVGQRVESIGYASDEEARMQQARPVAQPPADASKILQLSDWRGPDARGPDGRSQRPNDEPPPDKPTPGG